MKLRLLTAGLVTCLTLGMFQAEALAESNWASKCEKVNPDETPTLQQMNCLLTNAAINADIPPEVVKAVATQENGDWKQFDKDGNPFISGDGGIGLMQITSIGNYDVEQLKYNIYYNIDKGIEILNSKYKNNNLPKITGAGRDVIENWYFPVMAYNGIKPVNSPLYKEDTTTHQAGDKNTGAYQEQVFAKIEDQNYIRLGEFPFKTTDFQYDTNSDKNIEFLKKEYTLTDQMHTSTHLFKQGDKVVVTQNGVNLRQDISTINGAKKLSKGTPLIIYGTISYDNNNRFVWYRVTTMDSRIGFISSAYLTKKLDAPTVRIVDDNDLSISGTAPANSNVLIMNGNKKVGNIPTNASGKFIIKMAKPLKAGTKLTVTFKNQLNTISPLRIVTVQDKTAPKPPIINTINKTSKFVSGKTEAYATVHLKIGSKTFPGYKTKKDGKFKFSIKPQKAGTKIYVTATDKAKNKSETAKRVVIK